MKAISKLDEGITEIKNVKEDLVSFQMDLSSLLKGMLNSCVPGLKLLLILFCTHFRIGLHVRETKYWQFRWKVQFLGSKTAGVDILAKWAPITTNASHQEIKRSAVTSKCITLFAGSLSGNFLVFGFLTFVLLERKSRSEEFTWNMPNAWSTKTSNYNRYKSIIRQNWGKTGPSSGDD